MRYHSLAVAGTTLLGLAAALPSTLKSRQQIEITPVVGANSPQSHPRLPIGDIPSQAPDVWNMLLLAMESVYAVPEGDHRSYYQIAGIHGRPWLPWEHPVPDDLDLRQFGYCTHLSVLFGTWHRPYLILLEQLLVEHAKNIAGQFTSQGDKEKYAKAAEAVRIPYWDYADATAGGSYPNVMTDDRLPVYRPGVGNSDLKNPFKGYTFQTDEKLKEQRIIDLGESWGSATETSVGGEAPSRNLKTRRTKASNMFRVTDISLFSTKADIQGKPRPIADNLEDLHGDLHFSVFSGWMRPAEYAAFTPQFWLVHSNVDRQLALYQAMNPGKEIESMLIDNFSARTFMMPDIGETVDRNTPLWPFRKSTNANDYWTSRDVASFRSIYTYKYYYPELPLSYENKADADIAKEVQAVVNKLYTDAPAALAASGGAGDTTAWNAAVFINDESDVDQGLIVEVTLGNQTLGTAGGFTPGKGAKTFGSVPLSDALAGSVDVNDRGATAEYLKSNLQWKVVKDDKEVDIGGINGSVEVSVTAAKATYSKDEDTPPVFEKPTTVYEATEGKPGGASS